jgi:hypothetical protein
MSLVHEHHSAFDDRNLFLQVLMGLGACAVRYQTLLVRFGAAREPVAPRPSGAFLDACVGLAYFSSRVLDALRAAAAESDPSMRSAGSSGAALGRLLD